MFRGFNLVVSDPNPILLRGYGSKTLARIASENELSTLGLRLDRQEINGDDVKSAWFNNIPAQVFLSHSGKDRGLAYGLADFLEAELNVEVFVDSRVWGGADKLLKSIDDLYCHKDDGALYDYDKRNYSTSHVHMMLATALTEMIDRCECVIFLNTPESIQAADAKQRAAERVASPWIYHELMMTRLVRRHLDRSIAIKEEASMEKRSDAQDRALQITYEAPLDHLKKLTLASVQAWAAQGLVGNAALDWMYQRHAPTDIERVLLGSRVPGFYR